uniref:Uncharacterized protein n=1 Tax=Entamoeba invadens TaxID=33085 RepID=S0B3M1_ENTIV|nr:hypothetical protein [Entamoeba invadens]
MNAILLLAFVLTSSAVKITVTKTSEIIPTNSTIGEKCVGDIPQTEIKRIQKRVSALEARVEQFKKITTEISVRIEDLSKEENKTLSATDRNNLVEAKLRLYKYQIVTVKRVIKLITLIKKTLNILPEPMNTKLIENMRIEKRIKNLKRVILVLRDRLRNDKEVLKYITRQEVRGTYKGTPVKKSVMINEIFPKKNIKYFGGSEETEKKVVDLVVKELKRCKKATKAQKAKKQMFGGKKETEKIIVDLVVKQLSNCKQFNKRLGK